MELNIGLENMIDVIEDEYDEESLPHHDDEM